MTVKKLFVSMAVLASTVALSGPNPVAAAANPGTIVASYNNQAHVYELSATAVNAVVGDTIQVNNTTGNTIDVGTDVGANAGILSAGAQACNPLQAQAICNVASGNTTTYTVTQLGVITVRFSNGTKLTFTVGTGVGGATGPATTVKASFDPNGGECIFNGTKSSSKYDSFTIGFSFAPGPAECSRPGYAFADWMVKSSPSTSAGLSLLFPDGVPVKRYFVAQSGDFVARWEKLPPPRLDVVVSGLGVVYTTEQPGIVCGEGSFFTVTPVKYTNCGLDGAATRTLYALPQFGQSFLGWSGACANTPITAACTVSVTGSTAAVARFGLVNLTVEKQGSGTVSEFTFYTPRINCGATCSAGLPKDSPIFLVAAPAPGQYFVEWAGACAGTPSTSACSLTVANDTKATAVFAAGNRLVVDIDPREGNNGVVWSLPYGLICGGPFEACDVTFPPTVSEFTLFAVNGRDHRISGWGGACSGTATTSACSVSFATGSKERRVTVSYEERAWLPVATFDAPIYGMSRDGRTVLTGTTSTTRVLRENSRTGEWKSILELPVPPSFSRLSGDGNTVVTCVDDSGFLFDVIVRRWNEALSTWNQVGAPINATDSCPHVVSDNGSMFATGDKIYDWRAGTGSWVERSNPKDLILEAVNRQGTIAVFATLSPDWKLSYATYRWNADTSTWTRLESIEDSFSSIDRISDDGRFLFDFFTGGDQVYDTSLKSWTFPSRYRILSGGSVRGDAIAILEVTQDDRYPWSLSNLTFEVSVRRWDPTTSRWVQYGRAIGVGLPEAISFAFGLPYVSLSDESPGRVTIGGTIYEWSFPRR